ncbi:MAG: 30S ribosomal protein S1 [Planctomycetes bacterium]|nr:30S ribosomal protein S1 [Planctomycetota bacterium]
MGRAVKPIIKALELPKEKLEERVREILGEYATKEPSEIYGVGLRSVGVDELVQGKVVSVSGDEILMDIGFKCEGIISTEEFENEELPKVGEEFEVLVESINDRESLITVSKWKADRKRAWDRVIDTYKEGDQVSGKVYKKTRGGLLVDIGVLVFLPASQVGIRRAGDIAEYIGQELECKIIKIDKAKQNIVVSRRKLIEETRARMKAGLLSDIEEGQIRAGVVKNIVDFGAFVDLGGIDGLLHITDMTWGRVSHPTELVQVDQTLEVIVLRVDRERERIALGLKQLTENPWDKVSERYAPWSKHKGEVVNIMNYGAFVKLEEGIEGLVHVSEMSWTKRITHPSEVVKLQDEVEVVILDVNKEKQEISLGMKQCEQNPWTLVEEKYPVGTIVKGKVRNLANYGAFIEIEEGIDGLLHVTDMSWARKISNPMEVVKKGDELETVVLSVDPERKRVALGLKQLRDDPWKDHIPTKFAIGRQIEGRITKVTNFGIFVELEDELEGLLHVSELTLGSSKKGIDDLFKSGMVIPVEVIKLDEDERKIGLRLQDSFTLDMLENLEYTPLETEESSEEFEGESHSESEEESSDDHSDPEPEKAPVAQKMKVDSVKVASSGGSSKDADTDTDVDF